MAGQGAERRAPLEEAYREPATANAAGPSSGTRRER